MPPSFLTPPIELLTADGGFEPLSVGRFGRPRVLLARELCAFEHFQPLAAAGSAGLAAARLHARTRAPFHNPGLLIRRGPQGFGLWWWDMDEVGPHLSARFSPVRARLLPESLAQAPVRSEGDGWRILRQSSGYEAQHWRGGELLGSAWRRERFDEPAWAAFVRVQRGAGEDAPAAPPPAQSLPLQPALASAGGLSELTPGETAALAAGFVALGLVLAAAVQIGQGLRLGRDARVAQAQAAILRAAPASRLETQDRKALQQLKGFRDLSERPSPLLSLTTALQVLRLFEVEPVGFDSDGKTVSLTLPYAAIGKAERISAELAGTGRFTDVRPITQPGRKAIELRMRVVAAAGAS
jgi:hypothetical protein